MRKVISTTREAQGMATTSWRKELAINLTGLATLAAVIALGSYALRLDTTSSASSVKAYAVSHGLEYVESENRYGYARVLSGGGSGGSGAIRPAVAAQRQ